MLYELGISFAPSFHLNSEKNKLTFFRFLWFQVDSVPIDRVCVREENRGHCLGATQVDSNCNSSSETNTTTKSI